MMLLIITDINKKMNNLNLNLFKQGVICYGCNLFYNCSINFNFLFYKVAI